MAESYLRQSPLAHRGLDARATTDPGDAGLVLCERRFLARIALRGRAGSDEVRRALGVPLPELANTVETGNNVQALWLGPREWLLVGPPDAEAAMLQALAETLGTAAIGLADVTEGRTTLRLAGPMARDVLSMGCPLDLHPRVVAAGHCAQSFIAHSAALLHRVGGRDTVFDVHVERSHADYLWHWLETAAAPYGVAVGVEPEVPRWRRPRRRPSGTPPRGRG